MTTRIGFHNNRGLLSARRLNAHCHGPMHGYGIAKRIKQLSYDALTVEEGSLYPALFRLRRAGYVKAQWALSENNQSARYYALTAAGRKQLERETQVWERLAS